MTYEELNDKVEEMGIEECSYSDRTPWEIIEVKDEKHIVVRAMGYERIDKNGMSESQEYRYFSKPDGGVKHLVLRNGRWRDRIVKPVLVEDPEGEVIRFNDDGTKTRFRKTGTRVSNELGCARLYARLPESRRCRTQAGIQESEDTNRKGKAGMGRGTWKTLLRYNVGGINEVRRTGSRTMA